VQTTSMHCGLQDSPSSKLLYAKDMPRYRQMVSAFFKCVQESPPVTAEQVTDFMRHHSQVASSETCQSNRSPGAYTYTV